MSRPYPHYVLRGWVNGHHVYPAFNYAGFVTDPTLALAFDSKPVARIRNLMDGNVIKAARFLPVLRVRADLSPTPCSTCGGFRVTFETGLYWSEATPCPTCSPLPLTLEQQAI